MTVRAAEEEARIEFQSALPVTSSGTGGHVVRHLAGGVVDLGCVAGLEVSCAPEHGRAGSPTLVALGTVDVTGDNHVAGAGRAIVTEAATRPSYHTQCTSK